ncbi:hypothetical protein [Nocardia carnea]|uniref:hypothetical protein n=1 Tax=Nocardia carnea TaxID=37328 RepID=UPI002456B997|nr:hypothetical protein [Nocardia carnea]
MPTHYDRVRGNHAFQSMAGPEFTNAGAVFSPIRALPVTGQLVVWAALILIGMGGCTAAWIDQQSYVPSPNVCRSADSGVAPEPVDSCVPREQVAGVPR